MSLFTDTAAALVAASTQPPPPLRLDAPHCVCSDEDMVKAQDEILAWVLRQQPEVRA